MDQIKEFDMLPETGYVRLPQILRVIPVSKTSWWRNVSKGIYPKGVKVSPNSTWWKVEDIRALKAKIDAGLLTSNQ